MSTMLEQLDDATSMTKELAEEKVISREDNIVLCRIFACARTSLVRAGHDLDTPTEAQGPEVEETEDDGAT